MYILDIIRTICFVSAAVQDFLRKYPYHARRKMIGLFKIKSELDFCCTSESFVNMKCVRR